MMLNFLSRILLPRSNCFMELKLHSTFVGSSKEQIDSNLKTMDVISVFRPYAKFPVEEIGGECTSMAGEHYIEIYL